MMKYGEIKMIRRERKNGMYTDRYTVIYENGKKVFTINGAMMKKHFEFIMAADCTAKYNKDGRHTADIFTIPTEDQTTEDQAAEDQAAEDQAAEDQAAEDQAAEVQTTEDQTTEEIKKVSYDVFKTFQAGNKFDIYFHKPDRWKFDRPPVIAKETEYSVYYCRERDKNDVIKFLNRNATR